MKRIIAAIIISMFFAGVTFACEYDYECGQGSKCYGQFGKKYCTPK